MNRIVKDSLTMNKKNELYWSERKESTNKKNLYRKGLNICCMPDCAMGMDLQIHHMHPLANGGTDVFENYVLLCKYCHQKKRLHHNWKEKLLELAVFKFYKELEILGFTSDSTENIDDIFQSKLLLFIKERDKNEK